MGRLMAEVSRRTLLTTAMGAAPLMLRTLPACAAFPDKTITVIVPYPPGGTTDLLSRLVAEKLRVGLGATVVVENIVVRQDIAEQIASQVSALVTSADFQTRLRTLALEALAPMSPSQFAGFVKDEVAHWAPIVAASGASFD